MSNELLEIDELRVGFDGFLALDGLSLTIGDGELRFIIGPNGAGKTTLLDVATGLTRPTAGSVRFDGAEIAKLAEHKIVRRGIGRTFQNATVFDALTVSENLDLAASSHRRWGLLRPPALSGELESLVEDVGLAQVAHDPAGSLSHGQRSWLEIAMLLAQRPRLLLLDEPVAGMSKAERAATGELLVEIASQRTVVVIEHDMEFVRQFAEHVSVLHAGGLLREGSVAEVQADPEVQRLYLTPDHGDEASDTDEALDANELTAATAR
jgi:urea transport system ATP-binding protein